MEPNTRLNTSMKAIGLRIEVMRKKTELSLLQNELHKLESEMRDMELAEDHADTGEQSSVEMGAERPRRHLPDIPRGRREHVSFREAPVLNIYDESSIVGAESGTVDTDHQLLTSTPAAPTPKQPGKAQESSSKFVTKWWQRWDNDNCQTGVALPMYIYVIPRPSERPRFLGGMLKNLETCFFIIFKQNSGRNFLKGGWCKENPFRKCSSC